MHTPTHRNTPGYRGEQRHSERETECSVSSSSMAEYEFSNCVTVREGGGREKGRGEKLGETLVSECAFFFFSLSLLLLYAVRPPSWERPPESLSFAATDLLTLFVELQSEAF